MSFNNFSELTSALNIENNYTLPIGQIVPFTAAKEASNLNFHARITPKVVSDLAVHPKKVREVEDWFLRNVPKNNEMSFKQCNNYPLLLINGPSGSGKTVTVTLLCQQYDITIREWLNPVDIYTEYGTKGSQTEKFTEFLVASKWNSLFTMNSDKKIILIKELPNVMLRDPNLLSTILSDYCERIGCPIIFIWTDSSSRTSKSIFTNEMIQKHRIEEITFNSCAATLMKKALKRAQSIIEAESNECLLPSTDVIDAITCSSQGDLRTAINQLYFSMVMNSTNNLVITNNVEPPRKKRKCNNNNPQTIKNMMRDETLGLFHAVGRVLQPKFHPDRPQQLQSNFLVIIEEFHDRTQRFFDFLFANYLSYFGDFNDASKASDWLSEAACILEHWTSNSNDFYTYGLWMAVTGLMLNNKCKVSKWQALSAPSRINKSEESRINTEQRMHPTDRFFYNILNKKSRLNESSQSI